MVKKAFQDSNLIEIKGNVTASVATIGELKEVFGGGETGDVTVSVENITDVTPVGKSLLLAETQTLARAAIGAGTSNLQVGTTAGTAMAGNTPLLKVGTAATDAKAGNYKPTAEDISNATATGLSLIKAIDAAAARTAIGAGTSNLAIGTTASTAKAGDYKPTAEDISNASTFGRSFIKAADAETARGLIGAGTSNLDIGTSSTQAAAGNHTHSAGQISKTPIGDGDETGNMQEALAFLMSKISTLEGRVTQLENPTP